MGRLLFGQDAADDLAKRYGTPLYVIDAGDFRSRIRAFLKAARKAHEKINVAFASKANSALEVLRIACEEGLRVDTASLGEMEAAKRAGFKPQQIVLHGNNKSEEELHEAVANSIALVVVDNLYEIARLEKICAELKKSQKVLLRLAPGVDPVTHEAIRTGQEDSKFGLNIADGSAEKALVQVMNSPHLFLSGYHCHVGSQLPDSHAHLEAAQRIAEFAIKNWQQTSEIEELNIGGGLGIRYLENDVIETFDSHCQKVATVIKNVFSSHHLNCPAIGFEPGRSLIGEAGTTLYRVGANKTVNLEDRIRRYLSVDGGMADNPRPQLYGAKYLAMNASRLNEEHDTPFRISGRHCETDILIDETFLPANTELGDLIAIQCTGAYNASMASNYNRYPKPAMVMVGEGEPFLAIERETIEDLFKKENVRSRVVN